MFIERLYFGVRQALYLNKIQKQLQRTTRTQASALIRHFDSTITVTFGKSSDENFETYVDFNKWSIHIDDSDLVEEIILHEVGHLMCYKDESSMNYRYHQTKYYTREEFLESEEEAWDWAEEHATEVWGETQRLFKRACMDGYRSMKTVDMGKF